MFPTAYTRCDTTILLPLLPLLPLLLLLLPLLFKFFILLSSQFGTRYCCWLMLQLPLLLVLLLSWCRCLYCRCLSQIFFTDSFFQHWISCSLCCPNVPRVSTVVQSQAGRSGYYSGAESSGLSQYWETWYIMLFVILPRRNVCQGGMWWFLAIIILGSITCSLSVFSTMGFHSPSSWLVLPWWCVTCPYTQNSYYL